MSVCMSGTNNVSTSRFRRAFFFTFYCHTYAEFLGPDGVGDEVRGFGRQIFVEFACTGQDGLADLFLQEIEKDDDEHVAVGPCVVVVARWFAT